MMNPNFESVLNNLPLFQGTYTTVGGKITLIGTHYNSTGSFDELYGIPSRLFTQSQLEAAIRASEKGKTMSEAEIKSAAALRRA